MNRRSALVTIGLTALSGEAWSLAKPTRLLASMATLAEVPAVGAEAKLSVDERLSKDIARLKPRAYSEEGIPMFLACENLVPSKTSQVSPKVTLTALNTAFASELRRNTEAWKRAHPDAQVKDVAPIIEVLADRDFAHGGTVEEA